MRRGSQGKPASCGWDPRSAPEPYRSLGLRQRHKWWVPQDVMAVRHGRPQGPERAKCHFRAILIKHLRSIRELRVQNGIPLYFCPAIAGLTSHDCCQSAVGDLPGFIQRSIIDDGIDEVA